MRKTHPDPSFDWGHVIENKINKLQKDKQKSC
jgi:hypothetical protein